MASLLKELQAENAKSGLFDDFDTGVSYPMGFPILDQQLGFIQEIQLENGEVITQNRLGLTGGTINMLVKLRQQFKPLIQLLNHMEMMDYVCWLTQKILLNLREY